MSLSRMNDYGPCPCGGVYESRMVEVRLTTPEGEPIVLEDIPQGACERCGSRVYKADVLAHIESIFHAVAPH